MWKQIFIVFIFDILAPLSSSFIIPQMILTCDAYRLQTCPLSTSPTTKYKQKVKHRWCLHMLSMPNALMLLHMILDALF